MAAAGVVIRGTPKVVDIVSHLAVGIARQASIILSMVRAIHAQTNQAMLFTPATEDQARPDAHGVAILDITKMEIRAHLIIMVTCMIMFFMETHSVQYFEA